MFRTSSPASSMGSYPVEFSFEVKGASYSTSSLSSTGPVAPNAVNNTNHRSLSPPPIFTGTATPKPNFPPPLRNFSNQSNHSQDSWDINSSSHATMVPLADIIKVYSISNSTTTSFTSPISPTETSAAHEMFPRRTHSIAASNRTEVSRNSSKLERDRERTINIYKKLYSPPPPPSTTSSSPQLSQNTVPSLRHNSDSTQLSVLLATITNTLSKLIQTHQNTKGVYLHPKLFVTPQIYDNDHAVMANGIVQGVMIWDGSVKVGIINEVEGLLKTLLESGETGNAKDVEKSLRYFDKIVRAFKLVGSEDQVKSSQMLSGTTNRRVSSSYSTSAGSASTHRHTGSISTITPPATDHPQANINEAAALSRSQKDQITPMTYFTVLDTLLSRLTAINVQLSQQSSMTGYGGEEFEQVHNLLNKENPQGMEDLELVLAFINDVIVRFVYMDVLRCFKVWSFRCVENYLV
ncbi:hypothetical protein WICPIJ_005991 [Wickerhamomyces pijperi]|uniref:Uncharacterized protein n=1 Tax=Wickerhamomyces pijperi TaxID=599730 RepID=A0A9P8Q4L8_WICPI|nr:hypothetical protein WICPIJ_005991 [Wickerhamomyces pijperi]